MRTASFILLLITQLANAASWYVDNAATGSNNGTSWANAWQTMTNVVWGGAGVVAGDTLYISGGSTSKTYTNVWIATASGTSNAPITLRVGQDAGHNGRVIFDGTALGNTFASPVAFARLSDYFVIDGSVNGERRMMFQNIVNTNSAERSLASGIYASAAASITVRYVTASNVNNCIKLASCTNTVVHNNWLMGRGDGVLSLLNSKATGYDAHLAYSNTIICMWFEGQGGPDGIQARDGLTAYGNTFDIVRWNENTSGQHPDYIQCPGRWMKVYGNDFHNVGDSAIDKDPAEVAMPIEDVQIFNNMFRLTADFDSLPGMIRFYNTSGDGVTYYQNVLIANNTFTDNDAASIAVVSASYEYVGSGTNNVIANNVFVNCGSANGQLIRVLGKQTGYEGITLSEWSIVNNLFYGSNSAALKIGWLGTNYTAEQWRQSFDPLTKTHQPVFLSYAYRSTNNNLRLSPTDTSTIGVATPFNSVFTTDFDGTVRGEEWDLGAFEAAHDSASLLVHLTFEDDFTATNRIYDFSGNDAHAWQFGRPDYPTNWPKQTFYSVSPGARTDLGYSGDFYWYNDGWGEFGRSGDYAGITNVVNLTNMQTATIAVWARHFSAERVGEDNWFATQNATILSAGTSTGTVGTWDFGRFSMLNTNNNVRFMVLTNSDFTGGNNGRYVVEFPDTSNGTGSLGDTTNWNHYAVTWDNGTIRGYFNGTPISEAALHVTALQIGKNPSNPTRWIGVGCNTHGGTPPLEDETGTDYPNHGWWNGLIDDVRIYNRALTGAEIQGLAATSQPVARGARLKVGSKGSIRGQFR